MPTEVRPYDEDELPEGEFNPEPSEYFHLQPESREWIIILHRMVRTVQLALPEKVLPPGDLYLSQSVNSPYSTFNFRKTRFPADLIGRTIGADPETVSQSKFIRLKPLDKPEGLPKPTVDYWSSDLG